MDIESPNFITLDRTIMFFQDIHNRFSQTQPGKRLSQNTRWGRFQPEHFSNKEWISLIGPDAKNLDHCQLTYEITCQFINDQNQSKYPDKFSTEEAQSLKLTALTHDWPEGITINGDINYEFKTAQDEELDQAVIIPAITSIIGDSHEAIEIASQVKFFLSPIGKSEKNGQAFNCIEHIGYFTTCIKSWHISQTNPDQALSHKLSLLTSNVLIHSVPKLIEYSSKYFPARQFLSQNNQDISNAFNMNTQILKRYETPEISQRNSELFFQSRLLWLNWIKNQ